MPDEEIAMAIYAAFAALVGTTPYGACMEIAYAIRKVLRDSRGYHAAHAVWGYVWNADNLKSPHWWVVTDSKVILDPLGQNWAAPAVEYIPCLNPADEAMDEFWERSRDNPP